MASIGYHPSWLLLVDFLPQMDTFTIRFFSGTPKRTMSYLAIIKPFDGITWGLVAASLVAVLLALILIDYEYARWNGLPRNTILRESKKWPTNLRQHSIITSDAASGLELAVGTLVDEAVEDKYMMKEPCAKSRQVLVLMWILVGYLLTISYKSVLLATLLAGEYEKPINTVADVINSGRPVVVQNNTLLRQRMKVDPRPSVRDLGSRLVDFPYIDRIPQDIFDR